MMLLFLPLFWGKYFFDGLKPPTSSVSVLGHLEGGVSDQQDMVFGEPLGPVGAR